MHNKLNRNDLCLCGSGKKYKKCCLLSDQGTNFGETVDLAWLQLRRLEAQVIDQHLMPYVEIELPAENLALLFETLYIMGLPEEMHTELFLEQFVIPWFLFNWLPDNNSNTKLIENKTIAQNYIATHGEKLNSKERKFIEAMEQSYYSFYIIQSVVDGKQLIIKDILLGSTHTIKEKSASYSIIRGVIVFGRILTMDNQSILIGMSPFSIPNAYHKELIDYREYLLEEAGVKKLDANILREHSSDELPSFYFEMMQECYDQPLPNMQNTDGDPILFSKSYFKVTGSPLEVFEKLLPLILSQNPADFLEDAERNAADEITIIEFPWLVHGNKAHKDWDNTVMGTIILEEGKLILETNSEARTAKGKEMLKQYLQDDIIFQQTLLQTPEQMMRSSSKLSDDEERSMEEFLLLPEAQKELRKMAAAYWEHWFDERITALENKTPREAAKTKKGRELLEALLLEYERKDVANGQKIKIFNADIAFLKKELNIK